MEAHINVPDLIHSVSSYELPHRIHTAKVYPVQSPNGSTIIVYGHEHGLRILWRGGRPFRSASPVSDKEKEKEKEKPKVNGAGKNTIIIIDSDDDEPPPNVISTSHDKPTFEDEEEEYDPLEPYPPLLQHIDLPLGAEVLHIAFPQVPSEFARYMSASVPPLLLQKIVVATTGSDYSVRLITLPLAPPSPANKLHADLKSKLAFAANGKGPHGAHVLTLGGNAGHQTIPSAVSITYTSRHAGKKGDQDSEVGKEDVDIPVSPSRFRRRSHSKNNFKVEPSPGVTQWDLLLASHSPDITGMLLLYRIPTVTSGSGSDTDHTLSTENLVPLQVHYLPSPAINIAFSLSLYPSKRHSQLLVASAEGSVRIYDCLSSNSPRMDGHGSWLITIHSPFDNHLTGTPSRKRIIDAAWVLGGRGIITLLADGEWGVWDLEGTLSEAKTSSRRPGNGTSSALTTFALGGWLGSTASSSAKSSSSKSETKSKLAPMTPGTRRVREEVLFTGPPTNETYHLRGGISITKFEDPMRENTANEAGTLWHGTKILTIPDLHTYCETQVSGRANLFGANGRSQPIKIDDLDLGGEMASSVDHLPLTTPNGTPPAHRDLVIAAEHRLVFIAAPLEEAEQEDSALSADAEKPDSTDQQLLARGELDVGGMERVLAGMSHGNGNGHGLVGGFPNGAVGKRKVLFADLN